MNQVVLCGSAVKKRPPEPKLRRRFMPAALLGTITAATGYLLIVEGEEGVPGRLAGTIILTAGPPIMATFADRLFRALR